MPLTDFEPRETELPEQIAVLGNTVAAGTGFTMIVTVSDLVQPVEITLSVR